MTVRLLHALALGALAVGHNASAGRALVIGDNGRAGLGNVALGASSAFVYALLSAREVFLERTPLLERLCAALAPWPCAPWADRGTDRRRHPRGAPPARA